MATEIDKSSFKPARIQEKTIFLLVDPSFNHSFTIKDYYPTYFPKGRKISDKNENIVVRFMVLSNQVTGRIASSSSIVVDVVKVVEPDSFLNKPNP